MAGLWEKTFTWYRRRCRPDVAKSAVDIELEAPCRFPKRVDSGISFGGPGLASEYHDDHPETEPLQQPIHLNLDFGDAQYVKLLEYGTFSHWTAIEQLLADLERDGMILSDLWDASEKMQVQRGDWDARVRPGWDLHCRCQTMRGCFEEGKEDDNSSEDTEEEGWIDEVLEQYQEEWCLPRWRRRVEAGRASGNVKEPSWKLLSLGCLSVFFFIVAVVAYTA